MGVVLADTGPLILILVALNQQHVCLCTGILRWSRLCIPLVTLHESRDSIAWLLTLLFSAADALVHRRLVSSVFLPLYPFHSSAKRQGLFLELGHHAR